MTDINFWSDVAKKWTSVLDFNAIKEISDQAETTAGETIGDNNEELLDLFSALGAYRGK